jgi:hypothetical protein
MTYRNEGRPAFVSRSPTETEKIGEHSRHHRGCAKTC